MSSQLIVFSYAYRPMRPLSGQDGGFTVNLLDNDLLVFNTYDANRRITNELSFQLEGRPTERYLRMVRYASPWLMNVPQRMADYEGRMEGEYRFGFNGLPMLCIENLQSLVNGGYRDRNAHYARKIYCLLEDVATVLHGCGIELTPDSFNWNGNMVSPLQFQMEYSHYA